MVTRERKGPYRERNVSQPDAYRNDDSARAPGTAATGVELRKDLPRIAACFTESKKVWDTTGGPRSLVNVVSILYIKTPASIKFVKYP